MRSIVRYLLVIAVQLVLSCIFIVVFKRAFGYRLMVIPLHMMLVVALNAALILLLAFPVRINTFASRRFAPYVIGFLYGCFVMGLLSVYVVDYVANDTWGANVSVKVIAGYLPQFGALFEALPISVWWIYGPAAALVLGVFAVYLASSRVLFDGLQGLFLPERPFSLFRTRERTFLCSSVIMLVALAFVGFMARSLTWRGNFWNGEPLMGLFVSSPHPMLEETPRSISVAQEAQRIRAAYPKDIPFEKRNVFVIMSDSLRAMSMQVYGYNRPTTPFLMRLVDEGRLHRVGFATSTCPETACGMMSTFTSRNYIDLSFYNLKIYDLLQDLGYRVYFIGGGDHTNFHGTRDALGHHVDLFFDGACSRRYTMNDDRLVFEGLEQVPEYDGKPAFFFFFLMSTHQAGVKLETYERYTPAKIDGGDPWLSMEDPRAVEALVNRYDNGVVQADAIIGQILAALEQKGYLADAVGAIMADHGESLGDKGHFLHCGYLYEDEIGIPLLLYDDPGFHYGNLDFATQVDVAPTILDRLGLPIPDCWEGVSLLGPVASRYTHHTTLGTLPRRGVIYRSGDGVYKYIRSDPKDKDPVKEELYELRTDAHEERNLIGEADEALLNDLRRRVSEKYDHWQDQ